MDIRMHHGASLLLGGQHEYRYLIYYLLGDWLLFELSQQVELQFGAV